MILFIEPVSKNVDIYVPAYPLPLLEIASYLKSNMPGLELGIISMPVDYGLPLTLRGKEQIYSELLAEIDRIGPSAVGISCTAISQAEGVIELAGRIKSLHPETFLFVGGYFPTVYYEEIFSRTSSVDLIVIGEGEYATLEILRNLEKGEDPRDRSIPGLAWMEDGHVFLSGKGRRFDLRKKALLDLGLLSHPKEYEILPYAFSRGCPYHCVFCMEEFIRPVRMEVPFEVVQKDLTTLSQEADARTIVVSDALFNSFDFFPLLRRLDLKVNFETRCDVLEPHRIPEIADQCGILAVGFESASYGSLKRMNKVRNRSHFESYIDNTVEAFKQATANELPIMIFMIAGFPGDTLDDLEESLRFARRLSELGRSAPGGYIFKIGECRVYPKTRLHGLASSMPDVVFDNDGVFGQNVVRSPSKSVDFKSVLGYMREIFNLSHITPKMQQNITEMMPFFRLPSAALTDDLVPDLCFRGRGRDVFNVRSESLAEFRELVPVLMKKYRESMSGARSVRNLPI